MIGEAIVDLLAPILAVLAQSLPPGIDESITRGVEYMTPQRTALFGGSGLVSLATIRWLVKRGSSADVPAGTQVRTSGDATVASSRSSGGKSKAAFTLPSIIPLSKGVRTVTHDEVHALELGFVVGIVSAWLYSIGRTEIAGSIVVMFVVGSLGYKRYRSKAFKTVRAEPWYGLIALAIGGSVGYWLFLLNPELLGQFRGIVEPYLPTTT